MLSFTEYLDEIWGGAWNITTRTDARKFKFSPKLKKLWVKDLRSGKYTQTKGMLKEVFWENKDTQNFAYCCLGVLACRLPNGHWGDEPEYDDNMFYMTVNGDKYASDTGLSPEFLPSPVAQYLVKMNDDWERTFEQIADWIEENL